MHLYTWDKDPWVKYWSKMQYPTLDTIGRNAPEIQVDRSKLVGFFMPVFNSRKLVEGAYHSLVHSMSPRYPFAFIALDTGSKDGTVEFFKDQAPIFGNHDPKFPYNMRGINCPHPPPNAAVELYLGKYDKKNDRFEHEDRVNYLCWVHCDMDFYQPGWIEIMTKIYESDPKIGILSPMPIVGSTRKREFRGNASPVFISVAMLKRFYKKYGFFLDPTFAWYVACDDWDMHFRCFELGYKSLITHRAKVDHPTGGTRVRVAQQKNQEWRKADRANRDYYKKRWGTSLSPFNNDPSTAIQDNFKIPRTGQVLRFKDLEYTPTKEVIL